MESRISKVLDELTGVLGQNISVKPIRGGAINQSFCVLHNGCRSFLKLFDCRGADLLDRPRLFNQQHALAKLNLAPTPVYLSKNADFQVDQWIDNQCLAQSHLSRIEKCRRLARTLNKIHQTDICLPKLELQRDWRHYVAVSNVSLSKTQQKELQSLLAYWQQACEEWRVVCHNDLSLSHVPIEEHGVIFDWEYAASNSPYFDIASCCVINQLDEQERDYVIEEYSNIGLLDPQIVSANVTKMLPVVNKTYELWHLAFTHN